ncbi:MAG: hypothetical protein ACLFTK_04445 [Anaerolineales bacterium]
MDAQAPPPTSPPRVRAWASVAIVTVAGLLLYAWAPLYLMPPNVLLTPWIYIAGVFAWVPMALWVGRRNRGEAAQQGVAVVLAGLLLSCCLCGLLRPYGLASLLSPSLPIGFNDFQCEQVPSPREGIDRYMCSNNGFDARIDYEFEAPAGSPVGRLTRVSVDDFRSPAPE